MGGAVASYLPPFQLIGEASLLENLQSPGGEAHPPARATVVAAPGSRYVRWPQSAFYELQEEEDSDFAYAIQLMIARTLSQKLSAARSSQTVAEERLTERKRAVLRGVSPAALAAQRVGDSTLEGGAAAEVSSLLKQNQASACTCSRWRRSPLPTGGCATQAESGEGDASAHARALSGRGEEGPSRPETAAHALRRRVGIARWLECSPL